MFGSIFNGEFIVIHRTGGITKEFRSFGFDQMITMQNILRAVM